MSETNQQPTIIRDADAQNWVDRFAPDIAKPYLKLARFDRLIGAWLLLFPCWWGQALGHLNAGQAWPNLFYALLFFIGAVVMRGAGCTWNDIVDRKYDGQVERSALRPLVSGQINVWQALLFGALLCLVGLAVLVQFNQFTIWLGISSLGIVAIYPYFKRFTYWPQVILGLAFKWGALVGWSAVNGSLGLAPIILYIGCVCWTIGYDTIYAHQDKEDDAVLGLKSTALRFGEETPKWLLLFYGVAVTLWAAAGYLAGAGWAFAIAIGLIVLHCLWQILTLDTNDPDNCLARFKSNRIIGWVFLIGLLVDMALFGQ